MDTTISNPKHMIFKNIPFNNNSEGSWFLEKSQYLNSKQRCWLGKYEDFPYISKVRMSQELE